jgi:Rod binding domain-containing protein
MTDGILPLGNDMSMVSTLPALSAKANLNANVDAAAKDFEAMFATQLLQPIFETVPVNGTFGGGHGEEAMRSFLLQEYGKIIAKAGILGIAPQVKNEMLRAQESARSRGSTAARSQSQNSYASASAKGTAYVSS